MTQEAFDRKVATCLHHGETAAGIPFEWELAGSAGGRFYLLVRDESPEQVARAKTHLRNSRDVVSIKVERRP